jgi:hypothetical protein
MRSDSHRHPSFPRRNSLTYCHQRLPPSFVLGPLAMFLLLTELLSEWISVAAPAGEPFSRIVHRGAERLCIRDRPRQAVAVVTKKMIAVTIDDADDDHTTTPNASLAKSSGTLKNPSAPAIGT